MSCILTCLCKSSMYYNGRKIIKQYTDKPFNFFYGKLCYCYTEEKQKCEHYYCFVFNKIRYSDFSFCFLKELRDSECYMHNEKDDYCIQECNPVFLWALYLQTYRFTFPYRTVEENVEWLYTVNDFTILKDAPEEFRCHFPKHILDEVDYKIINL